MLFGKDKHAKEIQGDLLLMARIVEHTPVDILVTKTDGTILYANSCTEQDLKYSRNKLSGIKIETIISESSSGLGWETIRERLLRDKSCDAKAVLICKGGNEERNAGDAADGVTHVVCLAATQEMHAPLLRACRRDYRAKTFHEVRVCRRELAAN